MAIQVGDIQGCLYALHIKDGSLIWQNHLSENIGHNDDQKDQTIKSDTLQVISTVATDLKSIFVNMSTGQICALHPTTGKIQWCTNTEDIIYAPPLVTSDYLYVTTISKHLYVLNKHTGHIDQTISVNGAVYASPVICANRLCFGTENGLFYAFKTDRIIHP